MTPMPMSMSAYGRSIPMEDLFKFDLDAKGKLVLLYILDQAGDTRSVSLPELVSGTSLSIPLVQRTLNRLVESGYLLRQHSFEGDSYNLTNLAFDQHTKLQHRRREARTRR